MERISQSISRDGGILAPTATKKHSTVSSATDGEADRPMNAPPIELLQATSEMILRMYADHAQPQPTAEYRKVMAHSYARHFESRGVPYESVMSLYERTVASRNSNFIPTVSEFLAVWDGWLEDGFWQKRNDNADDEADLSIPALMAGNIEELRNAPDFVIAFAKFGDCVTCGCDGDRWGKPAAKIWAGGELLSQGREYPEMLLDYNESYWACATGKCNFIVDATALKPKKRGAQVEEKFVEPKRKSWQIAADDCGIGSDKMDEMQISDFREFLKWYNGQSSERLTPELFRTQWAHFAESKQVANVV